MLLLKLFILCGRGLGDSVREATALAAAAALVDNSDDDDDDGDIYHLLLLKLPLLPWLPAVPSKTPSTLICIILAPDRKHADNLR